MTATLRPLTLEDLHRVLELETALFGAGAWSEWMLREEIEGPYRHYLALTVRETAAPAIALDPSTGPSQAPERELLVGYGGTWFDGRDAQIMTIGIAPTHQGRGYGRILLDALLAHERERGAEQVFLEVRIDNELAIGMYERAGFEQLGRRRGYYQPENVDALTMRLALRRD